MLGKASFQTAYSCAMRPSVLLSKPMPEEAAAANDVWVAYQLVLTGRPFHFYPERLFEYRVHSASLSGGNSTTGYGVAFCAEQVLADESLRHVWAGMRRWASNDMMITCRALLDAGRFADARRAASIGRPFSRGRQWVVFSLIRVQPIDRVLARIRSRRRSRP